MMTEQEIIHSNRLAREADQAAGELMLKEDDVKNLADFPPELLVEIFSYVGSLSSNPAPPEYIHYIKATSIKDFRKRNSKAAPEYNQRRQTHSSELKEWKYKTKKEYAVRNLMMLRRVCTRFESIINNEMTPGQHYDFLPIDVRLQGNRAKRTNCPYTTYPIDVINGYELPKTAKKAKIDNSRHVTFFKYGGSGSVNPATRLSRIRRFNETEYEHVQKFERIRDLRISDMVLTEELFETILRLDLTKARRIVFERIQDFDRSINIKEHIKNFLETVDTPANVYFNSDVFNPNTELFEEGERTEESVDEESEDEEQEPMGWHHESSDSHSSEASDEEANVRRRQENMRREELFRRRREEERRREEADRRREEERRRRQRERDLIKRDIDAIEKTYFEDSSTHRLMRNKKSNAKDVEFRRYRALEMINNVLSSSQTDRKIEINWFNYATNLGVKNFSKRLIKSYESQMKFHAPIVRKAGKYHLNKLFKMLVTNNGKSARSVMFHSKMLKKIVTSASEIDSKEQEKLVRCYVESEEQRNAMSGFSFMNKYKLKSRSYFAQAHPRRRN